jgi:hypothetical protein
MTRTDFSTLVEDVTRFLDTSWTREPLLRRAASPDGFADVLTVGEVGRLLSSPTLRLPFVRLVKGGESVPESAYTTTRRFGHGTVTDAIDRDRVLTYFRSGATIVLDAVEAYAPGVARMCAEAAATLGCPADAVAFLTPPARKGLSPHIDDEDVFVLQVSGTKRWLVYPQLRPVPLKPRTLLGQDLGAPLLDVVLGPGDALYVPRGTPHEAASVGGHSLHVSLAARRPTLDTLVQDLVRDALVAVPGDIDIDAGVHPEAVAEPLSRRIEAVKALLDQFGAGAAGRSGGVSAVPSSSIESILSDMDGLADENSRIRVPGTLRVEPAGDQVAADFGGFRAMFPAELAAGLTRLAGGEAVTLRELAAGGDVASVRAAASQLVLRGAFVLAA